MPTDAPVYEIAKWKTVFETAESRKLKTLNWVSVPVNFSSSGYQQMLDHFGDDAPAIYGAWIALVGFAASCPVRGCLANSRGKSLPISHIARVTGFPSEIFARLIAWASDPDVSWLTPISGPIPTAENIENTVENIISGESPDDLPTRRENPPSTRQDRTLPDKTRPAAAASAAAGAEPLAAAAAADCGVSAGGSAVDDRSDQAEAVDPFFDGLDLASVRTTASRLRIAAPTLDRDVVWRFAAIGHVIDPELIPEVIRRLKAREIGKPEPYLEKMLRDECERLGHDYRRLKKRSPPTPPTPSTPSASNGHAATSSSPHGSPPGDPIPTPAFRRPPKPDRPIRALTG